MADIAVEKLKNRIIINNPGSLMFDEKKFGTLSVPRNRLIADLISKTHFMEKAGTGIYRIKDYSSLNGNRVEFDYDGYFFTTIYSNLENVPENVSENVPERLKNILIEVKNNRFITIEELAKKLNVNPKTIKRDLDKLKKSKGVLQRVGPDKGGYWEVIK